MKSEAMRYTVDSNEIRSMEFIGMVFHGRSITHLDSPAHSFRKGKIYNNLPAKGAEFCDAEVLKKGILTRGVLLDLTGKAGSISDLEAAEKKNGLKAGSGDVLLVKTGRPLRAGAASWFGKREIAVIGSDTPNDAPFFHTACLTDLGLWILDNCDLEELAKICKEKKRWEFLIFIAPLRLQNVTGSPVNPIAIF